MISRDWYIVDFMTPKMLWFNQPVNGLAVKAVRCDNGGENILLQKRMKSADWKFGTKFQFTARATPQQNSKAEKAFDTITGRGISMMNAANLGQKERCQLCKEAYQCATLTDGLTVITRNGETKTRYEHWCGKLPKFAHHLRTWGEAGVVKVRDLKKSKIQDKGITCMFVGYSMDHAGDCYRMFNPKTNRVHITRDIKWLNRMYFKNVRFHRAENLLSLEARKGMIY